MVKATPTKSRTPFYVLLLAIAAAAGGGIWYSMTGGKPEPITLAPGTPLPKAEGYLRGDPNAPVTIIEFGDFECPACGQFAAVTEPDMRTRIIDAGLANFRFFDYPLPMHLNTMSASLAASCAADQNKFWEMHDAIFAGQYDWNSQSTSNPAKFFDQYAQTIGLDVAAYKSCFSSQKNLARIEAHKAEGNKVGVGSTPTFIIGGKMYNTILTYDAIKAIVDSLRAAAPAAAPAATDTAKP